MNYYHLKRALHYLNNLKINKPAFATNHTAHIAIMILRATAELPYIVCFCRKLGSTG